MLKLVKSSKKLSKAFYSYTKKTSQSKKVADEGDQIGLPLPAYWGPLNRLVGGLPEEKQTEQELQDDTKAQLATWNSLPNAGFNVMPIPQTNGNNPDFVLNNSVISENQTFQKVGNAGNRGGDQEQISTFLKYEQNVFQENSDAYPVPSKLQGKQIHFEDGLWMFLMRNNPDLVSVPTPFSGQQYSGNFGQDDAITPAQPIPAQDAGTQIVKQTAVPHGNNLLYTGTVSILSAGEDPFQDLYTKSAIPYGDGSGPQPTELMIEKYGPDSSDNPSRYPFEVLRQFQTGVIETTLFHISTENEAGLVNSIKFGQKFIEPISGEGWFALQTFEGNMSTQLAYCQIINLSLKEFPGIIFPHLDCNTLELGETSLKKQMHNMGAFNGRK